MPRIRERMTKRVHGPFGIGPVGFVRDEIHAGSPQREEGLRRLDHAYTDRARRVVCDLFAHYQTDPSALPDRFARRIPDQGAERVICDYIAGMTDRFCTTEHSRLQGR